MAAVESSSSSKLSKTGKLGLSLAASGLVLAVVGSFASTWEHDNAKAEAQKRVDHVVGSYLTDASRSQLLSTEDRIIALSMDNTPDREPSSAKVTVNDNKDALAAKGLEQVTLDAVSRVTTNLYRQNTQAWVLSGVEVGGVGLVITGAMVFLAKPYQKKTT